MLRYPVDAIESALSMYVDDRREIPSPSDSRLEQLEAAFRAVGKRLTIGVEEAA